MTHAAMGGGRVAERLHSPFIVLGRLRPGPTGQRHNAMLKPTKS